MIIFNSEKKQSSDYVVAHNGSALTVENVYLLAIDEEAAETHY